MEMTEVSAKLELSGHAHVLVLAKEAKPKWIQKVTKSMEKKGTEGALHRYFNIPEDETIPVKLMHDALDDADISDKTRKRIQFALNMQKINRKKAKK